MNTRSGNQSDSDDTLTSSDLSDYDGDREDDDYGDTQSCRSLTFSVKSNRSTATVKNAKTKKKVRFKAGDKLVLVYVIPNRQMLGLHSASESSDSEYSASDSEDDDADGADDDKHADDDDSDENDDEDIDDPDDDEDDDDETDDDDDDDDDEGGNYKKRVVNTVTKIGRPKPRPIGRLVSIKQVNPRKTFDISKPIRRMQEPILKAANLDLSQGRQKGRPKKSNKAREKKETVKEKVELPDKPKKERAKKVRNGAIKTDVDKVKTSKRKRRGGRLLEIKATVETNHKTNVHVPKLVYKHDLRPSVVEVNGGNLSGAKPLTTRSKLQPTSVRLSRRPDSSNTIRVKSATNTNNVERPKRTSTVIASCYDSVSSLLPSSYSTLSDAFRSQTLEESIQRLDPNDMNAPGKRLYAWQIANGNITSQSLRTPSILPFLDSLKTPATAENGRVDVPS